MVICVEKDRCCYCGGCVGICPQNALELRETVLSVDGDRCIDCNICIKFCPVDALTAKNVRF